VVLEGVLVGFTFAMSLLALACGIIERSNLLLVLGSVILACTGVLVRVFVG